MTACQISTDKNCIALCFKTHPHISKSIPQSPSTVTAQVNCSISSRATRKAWQKSQKADLAKSQESCLLYRRPRGIFPSEVTIEATEAVSWYQRKGQFRPAPWQSVRSGLAANHCITREQSLYTLRTVIWTNKARSLEGYIRNLCRRSKPNIRLNFIFVFLPKRCIFMSIPCFYFDTSCWFWINSSWKIQMWITSDAHTSLFTQKQAPLSTMGLPKRHAYTQKTRKKLSDYKADTFWSVYNSYCIIIIIQLLKENVSLQA